MMRERRRADDPDIKLRNMARQVLYLAKKNKLVTQRPCEVCGSEYTVAHHEDYSKPLEVRWLCREHHEILHEQETD